MTTRKVFRAFLIAAVLLTVFAAPTNAFASGNCAAYITVQWGDTLSGIAAFCGTTEETIRAANPGLGWWLYAGQVLYIPTGYAAAPATSAAAGTYTIQWGDTLGSVATRYGVSLSSLLAANPQIWNVNLVYPGQVINVPGASASSAYYPPAPAAAVDSGYKTLKVIYDYGLIVRTGPARSYPSVASRYVSAIYGSEWVYRVNSATVDANGLVWVEVKLDSRAPYAVGWLLVRDTLGKYYTQPGIDP